MKKFFILIILLAVFIVSAQAQNNNLHIVQHNDTLWDLSKHHYKNPFLWGKIWMNNTYINDPNLIFPGEIIEYTKHGITIYQPKIKKIIEPKQVETFEKFDSAVWSDGKNYYSDCQQGMCVWKKSNFDIGKISFDEYKNMEVSLNDTVYIKTNKTLPHFVYVYRPLKDYSLTDSSLSIYTPIAIITINGKVKNAYKGTITKAMCEVSKSDIISTVYPFKNLAKKTGETYILNNVPVTDLYTRHVNLSKHLGYDIFLKTDKPLKNIVGKYIYIDRVSENIPENSNIGKGVVLNQYKNYLLVHFHYSNNLKEIMDRTQNYVIR